MTIVFLKILINCWTALSDSSWTLDYTPLWGTESDFALKGCYDRDLSAPSAPSTWDCAHGFSDSPLLQLHSSLLGDSFKNTLDFFGVITWFLPTDTFLSGAAPSLSKPGPRCSVGISYSARLLKVLSLSLVKQPPATQNGAHNFNNTWILFSYLINELKNYIGGLSSKLVVIFFFYFQLRKTLNVTTFPPLK